MRLAPLLLVAGCAANLADPIDSDTPADVNRKLGAAHGAEEEQVEYEMTFAGIPVGRFQVAVGKRGVVDGRDAVIVHSHASLAGAGTLLGDIDWDLTTTVDIASGFAIEETEDVTFDAIAGDAHHEHATRKFTLADRHHNAHSAAGALRGWYSAKDAEDTVTVTLFDHPIPVTIRDGGQDMVDNQPAIRYDGVLRGKHPFSVWVSDDTARVPLRMHAEVKIGSVDVKLVSYDVPSDH